MNRERLDKLVSIYIDKFYMLTSEEIDENMKWRAAYHFKNNFDINAENFYEMFKYAMSESSIVVNNGTVQPINGMLKLISYEPETVRRLFADLFADDGGNIEKRQDKIEAFVDEANKLLERYERGKWKYKQEFRAALAYLTFYNPSENYLYKSSQCQPFFRYLEFGEELGYGQDFKLSRYYKMCDELRYALAEYEDLMEIHNERWNSVGNPDDDLHILTFDLIYCSIVHGFYEFQNYSKSTSRNSRDKEQERLVAEIDRKAREIDELERELDEERKKLDDIPDVFIEGKQVKHKSFGIGTVSKQMGDIIEVDFLTRTVKFQIIFSFSNGFLSMEDESVLNLCLAKEACISSCKRIEAQINGKKMDISILSKMLKR